MPYYGIPVGTPYEEVGFGFHREVITGLLRERFGFDGIVCSDWGLINDHPIMGDLHVARAWGAEQLSPREQMIKVLDAGVDQFGGESGPELLVDIVGSGDVTQERLDRSVRRLLREKFVLGLFDQPLVDGIDAAIAGEYGAVVDDPAQAEVAILRLKAPYERRMTAFENHFHAGPLDFPREVVEHVAEVGRQVPTVVDAFLDRPAILTPIVDQVAALVINFGADLMCRSTPRIRCSASATVSGSIDQPFDHAGPAPFEGMDPGPDQRRFGQDLRRPDLGADRARCGELISDQRNDPGCRTPGPGDHDRLGIVQSRDRAQRSDDGPDDCRTAAPVRQGPAVHDQLQ